MDPFTLLKAPKNKKTLPYLRRKYYNGIIRLMQLYNAGARLIAPTVALSGNDALDEVRARARLQTDMSDHLETLFTRTLAVQPRLIVELGVGPGESTFVLERAAKISGARLVSVDVRQEMASASSWSDWLFVCGDDIEFARKFKEWTFERNINPSIDVLFIDTSHEYEHTVQEISHWFPFLSERGVVFFHDTNSRPLYRRKDGSVGIAPDTKRGVARALEETLQIQLEERKHFIRISNNWLITHNASCNGFTVLERLRSTDL